MKIINYKLQLHQTSYILVQKLLFSAHILDKTCLESTNWRSFDAVCDFSSLGSFFKKQQQEKQLRRPRGDGDNESVVDVDDDEFEKILGESRRPRPAGGATNLHLHNQ